MTKTLITSGDYEIVASGNLNISSTTTISNLANIAAVQTANLTVHGATVFAAISTTSAVNGNVTANLSTTDRFLFELTGNAVLQTANNPIDGRSYVFMVAQPSAGNCNFNWPANFSNPGNIRIGINTSGNSLSIQEFLYIGAANVFIPTTALNTIQLTFTA